MPDTAQIDPSIPPTPPTGTILYGLTGSRLYGLHTADSDYDWKGVYQAPSTAFFGLTPPAETIDSHEPDVQVHEVGKFVRLALKCNPTLMELLWLPEYEILTPAGAALVRFRQRFLWSKPVYDGFAGKARQALNNALNPASEKVPNPLDPGGVAISYGEYAKSQFDRLVARDGTYKSKLAKRTEKHTRHLFRLLDQGEQLLTTGTLNPRVTDPERLHALGRLPLDEMVPKAQAALERFADLPSVLPDKPDRAGASELLIDLRCSDLFPGELVSVGPTLG